MTQRGREREGKNMYLLCLQGFQSEWGNSEEIPLKLLLPVPGHMNLTTDAEALESWQLENCNFARVAISEHLVMENSLNLPQRRTSRCPESNWWCQKIHTGAFKALKSIETSRKFVFVLFLTSLIITFSLKATFSINSKFKFTLPST